MSKISQEYFEKEVYFCFILLRSTGEETCPARHDDVLSTIIKHSKI